ncbi:hypothetical protein CRD60_08490 [Bifidobacterium aemilianum]|uniref:Cell division protein FtsZ n=1 Tax=Bifidobacterium aemilianum TaxID=2493120 RepID=A0A366K5V6_9BIFI|nr:hypothetical protein CRD60_08490 [Bifidobacterium aemilianum]
MRVTVIAAGFDPNAQKAAQLERESDGLADSEEPAADGESQEQDYRQPDDQDDSNPEPQIWQPPQDEPQRQDKPADDEPRPSDPGYLDIPDFLR